MWGGGEGERRKEEIKRMQEYRLKEIERRLESKDKDREERRKNIVIEGMEEKEERRRQIVEGIIKDIGVEAEIEEIKKVGGDREKGRETVIVKLRREE